MACTDTSRPHQFLNSFVEYEMPINSGTKEKCYHMSVSWHILIHNTIYYFKQSFIFLLVVMLSYFLIIIIHILLDTGILKPIPLYKDMSFCPYYAVSTAFGGLATVTYISRRQELFLKVEIDWYICLLDWFCIGNWYQRNQHSRILKSLFRCKYSVHWVEIDNSQIITYLPKTSSCVKDGN